MANDVTTKFKVDISDLKKNISAANQQIKLAEAEFKNATVGMDDWAKSADGLSAAIEAQTKKVQAEEQKLAALKDEQARYIAKAQEAEKTVKELTKKHQEAAAAFGEDSDEAKELAKQLAQAQSAQEKNASAAEKLKTQIVNQDTAVKSAKNQLDDYKNELNKVETQTDNTGEGTEELNKDLEETDKQAKETTEGGLSAFGVALGNLAANVIAAAVQKFVELAKASADAFKELDEGRDILIKATGATGEAAAEITQNYKNVAKTVNADLTDVGAAIGEVQTRFGLAGDELEDLSATYLKFADITGSGVVSAVDDTQKALSAYGLTVKDAEHFLDSLAKTSQDTGINTSDLTNGIITNATAFQEMGLTIDQAVTFMGQLEKSGANSETVLNGMRKALQNSAKDGKDLNTSLTELQDAVENGTDGMDGLNAAYKLFGKTGDQIYGAIKNGTLSFEDLTTAAVNSAGAVSNTYEETQSGIDKLNVALQALKITAGDAAGALISEFSPQIEEILGGLGDIISGTDGATQKFADAVGGFLSNALEKIVEGLPVMIDTLMPIIEQLAEKLVDLAPKLLESASKILTMVTNSVVKLLPKLVKQIAKFLSDKENIKILINASIELFMAIVQAIPEIINALVPAIPDIVRAIIEALQDSAPQLWDAAVTLVTEAIPAIFMTIADTIGQAVTELVATFDELIFQPVKMALSDLWTYLKTEFLEPLWESIEPYITPVVEGLSAVWTEITEMADAAWGAIKAIWDFVAPYFGEIWTAIQTIFAPVADFFGAMFGKAEKDGVEAKMSPLVKFFKDLWAKIKKAFSAVASFFSSVFGEAWRVIKEIFGVAGDWFTSVWNSIKAAFKGVEAFFKGDFQGAYDAIVEIFGNLKTFFGQVWDHIKNIFKLDTVKQFFYDKFNAAKDAVVSIWSGLEDFFGNVWGGVKNKLSDVKSWFTETFRGAWNNVKSVFDLETVKTFFGNVWETIKGKFESLGSDVGEAVGGAFKAAINGVIEMAEDAINFLPSQINGVLQDITDLTGKELPLFGEVSFPRLAKGGVIDEKTFAEIGEAGKEAIIPLENNKAGLKEIARLISGEMPATGGATQNYNFTQTFNSPKALSRYEIYRQQKNLLHAAKMGAI